MSTYKIMDYVDPKKTIESLDYDKAVDLLGFHLYLRSKNLWTIEKEIKFIKLVDKYVKKAIKKQNKSLLDFCKLIMEIHFKNLLFHRKILNDKGKNPFTLFLKDCKDTKVQESKLGADYIQFLVNQDDNFIHQSIYEDVKENCQSPMFSIGEEKEMNEDEEKEMKLFEQMELTPRDQRIIERSQRALRSRQSNIIF
jgi:hypothetical protein